LSPHHRQSDRRHWLARTPFPTQLQGQVVESAGELAHFDAFEDEENPREAGLLYDIRVLFGSTEIEFYELLLRRIMSLIW
jgi:hypothetical protein